MCGRYTRRTPLRVLASLFDCEAPAEMPPRYNIAPTQPVAAIRRTGDGRREIAAMRWGLVPSWATDVRIGNRLINARSETVATKPAFRAAFQQRRCLIPADSFYEWRQQGKEKQPFLIQQRDGQPLAFAGLWERWQDDKLPPLETCAILTTSANELMKPLHERMPVILAPTDWPRWLDAATPPVEAEALLRPWPDDTLSAMPVSTWVNNPRHDDPRCLEAAATLF
ncbi:MAG: SOS response-associated peptidase [Planctomycetia bacterium]|nr:SOS response-associated peptidase [Planctomycetia bacterium]